MISGLMLHSFAAVIKNVISYQYRQLLEHAVVYIVKVTIVLKLTHSLSCQVNTLLVPWLWSIVSVFTSCSLRYSTHSPL